MLNQGDFPPSLFLPLPSTPFQLCSQQVLWRTQGRAQGPCSDEAHPQLNFGFHVYKTWRWKTWPLQTHAPWPTSQTPHDCVSRRCAKLWGYTEVPSLSSRSSHKTLAKDKEEKKPTVGMKLYQRCKEFRSHGEGGETATSGSSDEMVKGETQEELQFSLSD